MCADDNSHGDPPSPDQIVGGRRTLPPGSQPAPAGRVFVNPYIEKLAEYPALILTGEQAESLRGHWTDAWPADAACARGSLSLEIGSGNGFFLREMCRRHPERRFVGVEIRYKRVWMAARKLDQVGHVNGRVVLHHAGYLARMFEPRELAAVYLNHPDPWPKDRHARNRIITPAFSVLVESLLNPGGLFQLKSDHAPYAEDARRCFGPTSLAETAFAADLHRPGEPLSEGNVQTNYERKFVERGEPVFLQRWVKSA
jgi:tRNA (guanine-N7-)-methyltransferase